MTANLDYLKPYADTVSSGSARRIEERRHGGWLLELERALLEDGMTRSASRYRHDGVERHRDTGDASCQQRLPMLVAAETVAAGDPACAAQNRAAASTGPIARVMQTGPDAVAAQDDTSGASTTTPGAAENGGQDHARPLQGSAHSIATMSAGVYSGGISYRLPVQQQAVSPKDDLLRAIRPHDFLSSRMPLQRGISEVPYFTAERSTGPQEQEEADRVAAPQDTKSFQDNETYARRKLHLFQGEDGVHAWIRDLDVGESGVHAIARALNAELAASGLKLAALTLNGKRLAQLFQKERIDDEERAAGSGVSKAADTGALSPATQPITEKGAY